MTVYSALATLHKNYTGMCSLGISMKRSPDVETRPKSFPLLWLQACAAMSCTCSCDSEAEFRVAQAPRGQIRINGELTAPGAQTLMVKRSFRGLQVFLGDPFFVEGFGQRESNGRDFVALVQ